MTLALLEEGITEDRIAWKLGHILDKAFTSTPEWQIIPDFKTMLDAIKVYLKMQNSKPETQINIANIFWWKEGGL